jgi:hypothetical protein
LAAKRILPANPSVLMLPNEEIPSFVVIQSYVAVSHDRTSNIDDAMVRDGMKAKGYDILLQSK